jgi:hypothetical protein
MDFLTKFLVCLRNIPIILDEPCFGYYQEPQRIYLSSFLAVCQQDIVTLLR